MRRCRQGLDKMLRRGSGTDFVRPGTDRLPPIGEYKWKAHDGFPRTVYLTRDGGVNYAMWATCHKTGRVAIGPCHVPPGTPGWWLSRMNEKAEFLNIALKYKLTGELR